LRTYSTQHAFRLVNIAWFSGGVTLRKEKKNKVKESTSQEKAFTPSFPAWQQKYSNKIKTKKEINEIFLSRFVFVYLNDS
jgi:hypothetical protein